MTFAPRMLTYLVLHVVSWTTSLPSTKAWITTSMCRGFHHAKQPVTYSQESGYVRVSDTASTMQLPSSSPSATMTMTSVSLPPIRWTVPGTNRGWQDDNGDWWDENGKRNGPPLNYWRQMIDERAYQKDMKVVQEILEQQQQQQQPPNHCDDITITNKLDSPVAHPLANSKLLGIWAPIVRNGKVVANSMGIMSSNDVMNHQDVKVQVPYTITIARPGQRKIGRTTGYGTFDAHMTEGEPLVVTVQWEDETTSLSLPNMLRAAKRKHDSNDEDKDVMQDLGIVPGGVGDDGEDPLKIGNISHLSEYLLVMPSMKTGKQPMEKDPSSTTTSIQEFWIRAKPIQPIPKQDVERLREEEAKAQAEMEEATTMEDNNILIMQ